MSGKRKHSENIGKQASRFLVEKNGVPISIATLMKMSNQHWMTPFNLLVVKQNAIEPVPSQRSLPRKDRPTSPKGASSFETWRTLCYHARAIIAKTRELLNSVCRLIKTNRPPWVLGADVHGVFKYKLGSYRLAGLSGTLWRLEVFQ